MGRQVFAQSCGVCHLPPTLGARTYGPALNKDAGGGDDDVVREFIDERYAAHACLEISISSPPRSTPSSPI